MDANKSSLTPVLVVYYIQPDQLDTPRTLTDTSGNVVWQYDNADPFGNNTPNENPSNQGAFHFNLRFPGQYYDTETSLAYYVNRDYDASIGRYVESDPIGLYAGVNTYTYVGGNPLKWVDPLGLFMIYGHDTGSFGDYEIKYTLTFQGLSEIASERAGDFLLGKIEGIWGKIAKEGNKKIKTGAGMCDIKGFNNQREAAAFDSKLEALFNQDGYKADRIGGSDLAEQQLRDFLNQAYQLYPELTKYYPSVDDLINTAHDRAPKVPRY